MFSWKQVWHRTIAYSLVGFLLFHIATAADMTSTSFIIRDPLVGTGGGFGTSASFKAFSSGDMTMIGESSSASFKNRYGFLYYPYATAPVLSGNLSGIDVVLNWTATTAGLGWNVSGYKVGKSTVSGSGYAFTSVGNVLTYTYTSVAPGTYYFIVQTLDAFGNVIATSNEISVVVPYTLTFSISANSIQFGTLSTSGPRYATTSGGSGANSVAHTIAASSNAANGYTITYQGPTLTSGAKTIASGGTTISGSSTGTPGSEQFAISLSTTGGATIPSAYRQSLNNWAFSPNSVTQIAGTAGATASETYSLRYISNISGTTAAGQYSTSITYVITGNF